MNAQGVLGRFLSLLDLTLILLGLLMITLMQTQLRSAAQQSPPDQPQPSTLAERAEIDVVCLWAGWQGPQNGRCYLLDAQGGVGREVRTDVPDDLQELLASRREQTRRGSQVVLLLFSDDGWYAAWDDQRLAAIERVWGRDVAPVYKVKLPRQEHP